MPLFRDLALALGVLFEGLHRSAAWRLGTTAALAIIGGALAGLAPLALKDMIDGLGNNAATGARSESIVVPGAVYLLCICATRVLAELRPVMSSAAEQHLYARLRSRFFGHLLELPLHFHLGRRTGAVVQTLQQAVSGYQIIVYHLHSSVLPVAVELATVTLVLASLGQPALMTTFAITALAYVAVLSSRAPGLGEAAQSVSKASHEANALLTDGLLNYEPIKSFGAERSARDRFDQAARTLESSWARLHGKRMKIGFASAAVSVMSMTTSLAIAAFAVSEGRLTVGGFVLANLYMLQILRPLEMIGIAIRDVTQSLALTRPLLEVLKTPADSTEPERAAMPCCDENGTTPENAGSAGLATLSHAPRISFRGIWLAYDDGEPVLTDFSLEVPAGRSVAIVGASGSGKSTLVRLLLRFCDPQAGCILIGGIAINTLPMATLRALVAVVPQDVALFNTTIAANIGIAKETATPAEIARAAQVAGLHEFVRTLPHGYETSIGERGLKLSGGERQRIAIARAVLRNPSVYLFDEATSMLDAQTEAAILRNLRAISSGHTTITIAHRLSVAKEADELAVLEGGRIIEQGDHASLMSLKGAYAAMWRTQHPDH